MSRGIRNINVAGKRCVIAGLVSAKENSELLMEQARQQVVAAGGCVVATILQRRGVSRSKRPGGSKVMNQPLDAATVMSRGKVAELVQACKESSADVVVFVVSITQRQRDVLSDLTGCEVARLDLGSGQWRSFD